MSIRTAPVIVALLVATSANAQGVNTNTGGDLDFTGSLSYRYSDDAPSDVTARGVIDYISPSGFGIIGGGQVRFLDSDVWGRNSGDATIWSGDAHGYYSFQNGLKLGAYYSYEGDDDIDDFQYYGGEIMYSYLGFDLEGKLGIADNADGRGHATTYEAAMYYEFPTEVTLSGGYGRIDDSGRTDMERAFARVSYGGLIPNNNMSIFAEVSYYDYFDDDVSIRAGFEWTPGVTDGPKRRAFRKPISYLDF